MKEITHKEVMRALNTLTVDCEYKDNIDTITKYIQQKEESKLMLVIRMQDEQIKKMTKGMENTIESLKQI